MPPRETSGTRLEARNVVRYTLQPGCPPRGSGRLPPELPMTNDRLVRPAVLPGLPNTGDKLQSSNMLGFVSFIPLFDGLVRSHGAGPTAPLTYPMGISTRRLPTSTIQIFRRLGGNRPIPNPACD